MKILSCIFLTLSVFFLNVDESGRKKNHSYVDYAEKYGKLAVYQMEKYKIPASITLAQGILETKAGTSGLLMESNNHFGIKCHAAWTGAKVYWKDDRPNECFRKYKKAEDSYEDHSLFLTENGRYAELFNLDIRDYKAWAKGLQKCGFATDKAYANKLIKIIEDNELYHYDTSSKGTTEHIASKKDKQTHTHKLQPNQRERNIYKTHGLIYVIANENDSFASIADDLGFKIKNLIKYNEVPSDFPLYKGDIVYLEKKKKKADKPYYEHIVQVGESMHSISQRYAIRLSNLYKMNKKNYEYVPEEGDVLRIR